MEKQPSGCWLWMGARDAKGYGLAHAQGTKTVRAHRFAYQQVKGTIAAGLQLDHLCRVRACVNPDHLEPVTGRENLLRSPLVGQNVAERQKAKTHCPRGHAYDEANTIVKTRVLSDGEAHAFRDCRACRNERQRSRRALKKAGEQPQQ